MGTIRQKRVFGAIQEGMKMTRILAVAMAIFVGGGGWCLASSTTNYSPNGLSVYNGMWNASSNNPAVSQVDASFQTLSSAQQTVALRELSGEAFPAEWGGVFCANQQFLNALERHRPGAQPFIALGEVPQGPRAPAPAAPADHGIAIWAQGLATWADQDNDKQKGNSLLGYESDGQGFIVGADKTLDRWVFGVSTGGIWTDVDSNDIEAETDVGAFHIGPYASFNMKRLSIDAGLVYSASDIDTSRHITFLSRTATADTDADTWAGYLNAGYAFSCQRFTLTPTTGLTYTWTGIDGYKESGAGGANLRVREEDMDSCILRTGLNVAYSLNDRVTFTGVTAWNHNFVDSAPMLHARFSGGSWFDVTGLKPDTDTLTFGAGCVGKLTDSLQAFANYDYTLGDEYGQHDLTVGIRFNF
jgi:outer membrane autotransporter protein